MPIQDQPPSFSIAVYGPTQSGKSTLIRAFLHAINDPSLRVPLDSDGMSIGISYWPGNQPGAGWKQIASDTDTPLIATQDLSAPKYRVERTASGPASLRRAVSVSYQNINIVDDRGGVFEVAENDGITIESIFEGRLPSVIDPIANPGTIPLEADRVQFAWEQLAKAHIILLVLDAAPLRQKSADNQQSTGNDNASKINATIALPRERRVKIERHIRRLIDLKQYVEDHAEYGYPANKRVAVCCVKVDNRSLYRDRETFMETANSNPSNFIRSRFGNEVISALDALSIRYRPENVYTRLVSSTGWDWDGKSNAPDNPESGKVVQKPDQWRPHNVIETFQWVLEELDNMRMEATRKQVNGLWAALGDVHRRKQYRIPYGRRDE